MRTNILRALLLLVVGCASEVDVPTANADLPRAAATYCHAVEACAPSSSTLDCAGKLRAVMEGDPEEASLLSSVNLDCADRPCGERLDCYRDALDGIGGQAPVVVTDTAIAAAPRTTVRD